MSKTIGSARVSTRAQATDRQITDLIAAGVRRDDLYTDHGVSGARNHRPALDQALRALQEGDTLAITTLDRLGRSTANMLNLATDLRQRHVNLRVLNLGGGDVDTGTPMGAMVFTVMAALAQMELDIKRERITDSISKRRAVGKDLGGRRNTFTTSQIENARRLVQSGEPATQVAKDLGMSRATLYRRIAGIEAQHWINAQS
jgi:DNA invertase Pin-like site-specific DNA recombinase